MTRYLVEISHENNPKACEQAARLVLDRGSHLVTNADLGCQDHVHKSWIIIEGETKDEVRNMLPSIYRSIATITGLTKFSLEGYKPLSAAHG